MLNEATYANTGMYSLFGNVTNLYLALFLTVHLVQVYILMNLCHARPFCVASFISFVENSRKWKYWNALITTQSDEQINIRC